VGDFVSVDKRGLTIVFPQKTWDHATDDREHFTRVKGNWRAVMFAFAASEIILDNPPLEEGEGPPRVAHERYVGVLDEDAVPKEYIVVPVIVKTKWVTLGDGRKLEPPVRVAWTVYPETKIPTGTELWKWQQNSKS
jgi:hypothetical protein